MLREEAWLVEDRSICGLVARLGSDWMRRWDGEVGVMGSCSLFLFGEDVRWRDVGEMGSESSSPPSEVVGLRTLCIAVTAVLGFNIRLDPS